jgi:ATP-dependent DNA helicase RecQ
VQPPPAILDDLLPRQSISAARKPKAADEPELVIDSAAAEIFEKLRVVRLQLARDRQLPAYCICHDSTLKLIAVERPADADALEGIKGMGPMKVRLYGEAILAALSGD